MIYFITGQSLQPIYPVTRPNNFYTPWESKAYVFQAQNSTNGNHKTENPSQACGSDLVLNIGFSFAEKYVMRNTWPGYPHTSSYKHTQAQATLVVAWMAWGDGLDPGLDLTPVGQG